MKIDKYTFVKGIVFKTFIAIAVMSSISGVITLITSSFTVKVIFCMMSYLAPAISAMHIIPTYIWNDGDMAIRNRRVILPIIAGLVLLRIII